MVHPDPQFLGIEIGGTKLQIVAGDGSGRISRRWRAPAHRDRGGPEIRDQLSAGLLEIQEGRTPLAVGVGFGGPIDYRTGVIARSHQVEGWEEFGLSDWLANRTGAPVAADNDANVAALAEAVRGAGKNENPVFYFNLGSGVGGGLVVDKKIYHGITPGEMEFGHLRIDRVGTTVESRCSGWAIDSRIRQAVAEHPTGPLAALAKGANAGEARHLPESLRQSDPVANRILDELSRDLAYALSHVVHLLHPSSMVMGGGLSLLGEPLRQAVERRLSTYVMQAFQPAPPVRLAGLGEDAVPIGALLLACSPANA